MKKAIITIGVSASGKSTWAQEFAYDQLMKGTSFHIIERDKIRADILFNRKLTKPGDGVVWAKWKWKWENEVTAIADEMLEAAIANEFVHGVIFSDTNLNAERRKALANTLVKKGFEVEEKFFDISSGKFAVIQTSFIVFQYVEINGAVAFVSETAVN